MKRSVTAGAVTAGLVVASALTGTATASATATPQAVPSTRAAWTAHARNLGHAAPNARVDARVYLAPRGGIAALRDYALAVSTPGTAKYRHFLTASGYRARFGPTDATVRSLVTYLRHAGLTVDRVAANNRYLAVHGSTRQAEQAFGTTLDTFLHDGTKVQAPTSAAKLPAALAGAVLTVSGLDTTPHLAKPATAQDPAPTGFRNARPCSRYFGQLTASKKGDFTTPLPTFRGKALTYVPCGYTGPQFRSAYEGATTLDGSGVTVAITDAYNSPWIASDANRYAVSNGDGAYSAGQLSLVGPGRAYRLQSECGPSGWYGEQTLDVEAVHAMAPGAKIRYYAAASCGDDDLLNALANVVDDDKAQIVTNSWSSLESGESTDGIAAYESVFLQGAAEGISFAFSSGDDGDELASTGLKQVGYPSSDPYVTGVGGTSLAIGAQGTRLFETGWGVNSYGLNAAGTAWNYVGTSGGGGGGSSTLFNRPSYQDGATTAGSRQVPDVAMDADAQTGMLVGQTQTFTDGVHYDEYRIGGTSLASPLFAGMTALAFQKAGGPVGLLNPTIYQHRSAFTDIKGNPPQVGVVRVNYNNSQDPSGGVSYFVRTLNQDTSLSVGPGYDQVTGVGVPNTGWLTSIKK